MINKIIFTIVVYCLPELLALILLGVVGYVVCAIVDRQKIGLMMIVLTVFCGIDIVLSKISGLINSLVNW